MRAARPVPRRESSAAAKSLRQWPLLIILGGVLAGMVITLVDAASWRLGCLVIGASLGVGAIERIVLPSREAGLLQVRSKAFDVTVFALGAIAVIALALAVPDRRR